MIELALLVASVLCLVVAVTGRWQKALGFLAAACLVSALYLVPALRLVL